MVFFFVCIVLRSAESCCVRSTQTKQIKTIALADVKPARTYRWLLLMGFLLKVIRLPCAVHTECHATTLHWLRGTFSDEIFATPCNGWFWLLYDHYLPYRTCRSCCSKAFDKSLRALRSHKFLFMKYPRVNIHLSRPKSHLNYKSNISQSIKIRIKYNSLKRIVS